MPIDDAHPLEEVYAAAVEHAKTTQLAPLWAVTLLEGVNDAEDHAHALATLALRFRGDTGFFPRISVIPYNRIADDQSVIAAALRFLRGESVGQRVVSSPNLPYGFA
jgi:23S rRNA (adenine2503-C2)-methyltransferase